MTLQQWVTRYGIKPTHSTTERGAVSVIMPDVVCQSCVELYYLDDYVVSSRSGLVLWLVPRKPDPDEGLLDDPGEQLN